MDSWKVVQLDTETEGLDVYTKRLLTVQFGTRDIQIVVDCTSVDVLQYKSFLESNRVFLGWNLLFDLKFLYHHNIYPNNIYDGMLAEKLIWLGYPAGMKGMSLKDTAFRYLGIDIDKTIRGKINQTGLTEDVIVYAAGDVQPLEDIKDAQEKEIQAQELETAVSFENEFVKCLAYIEYCGVRLDVPRWKAKMENDLERLNKAEKALNDWVVSYYKEHLHDPDSTNTLEVEVDFCLEERVGSKVIKHAIEYKTYTPIEAPRTVTGPDYVSYLKQKLKVVFPFVKINLQGDLFSGFDTEPKCCINWSSSKQVIPLFELLGFNLITFDKVTKKKKKSVDAKIIKAQLDVSPIAALYLDYQGASKVVSTYGQNWLNAINPVTGRIHANFYQLGADTARLSCGGGTANVNVQNLPHDPETRACFIPEDGNDWISADYQGQESRIIASVSNDTAMLDLFINGCGDVHSLVAKMAYSHVIGDTPIEEIKEKFPQYRQEAKGIEFAVNYGGDANTIMNNKGIPLSEAKAIYENFMRGFPGVAKYQDYCRREVMKKGYILLNPVTKHRAHIYDFEELDRIQKKFDDPEFWDYYREMKKYDPSCETVKDVQNYFRRKSASEKQSINYRIQNRGAMMFKLASIKLFNYLKKNNLLGVVKYCIPVHDEINLECPKAMSEEISKILVKCMKQGAKPFCTRLPLGADVSVGEHWIH